MSKTKFFLWSILLTFLFSVVFIGAYFVYSINYRGMKITNTKKIQDNYAEYMINKNDEFIDCMIEFESYVGTPQKKYSEEEISRISDNITKQNAIMKEFQLNPPNTDNKDYLEIYKDYLKLYAFYIQGEVMRMEYFISYRPEYTLEEIQDGVQSNEETYIMGVELCNMMGSLILENSRLVNQIRNTSYNSKHNIIPLDEWNQELEEKEAAYNAVHNETDASNVEGVYGSFRANNGGKTPVNK